MNCCFMSIERFWILVARKLSGESSDEEIRELEELIRSHPHLHFSIEIITNLWNQESIKDQVSLQFSYSRHLERMKNLGIPMLSETAGDEANPSYLIEGSRKGHLMRKLGIAASIIVTLAAGGYYYFARETKPLRPAENVAQLAVSTKYGSRTNIQLPDGSKVWLNSGSTLTYDKQFGKEIREVVLSGEAFFDIVKNAAKPFIIHTANMDIKVLGTQFNVKSYANDNHSEASLIHGSIEVALKKRGSEKILLKPNEKIVVMNEAVVKNTSRTLQKSTMKDPIISVQKLHYDEKDSTIIETSWVDHKLYFSNESFEEIAVKMERWYGIPVVIQDPDIRSMRFTGSFTTETVERALEAIKFSTPFNYLIKENKIVITK